MTNGGERGPQMSIIPQGQDRINPRLFTVTMEDVTDIPDNMVGIVTATVAAAEGEKILAVGTSEAEVIKKKTAAMDPEKYAMVEVARALAGSGFKLVPDIIATGGADGGNSLVNILLASVIRDTVKKAG